MQIESLFQISLAIFDTYCLAEASPGSTHFRSFGISFLFVYSGNPHSMTDLWLTYYQKIHSFHSKLFCFLFSSPNTDSRRCNTILCGRLFVGLVVNIDDCFTQEHEIKFIHWLRAMAFFIVWRTLTIIFQSLVNVSQPFLWFQSIIVCYFKFYLNWLMS